MGWFENVINTATLTNAQLAPYQVARGAYNYFNQDQSGDQLRAPGSNPSARAADMAAGYAKGREIFKDDPEMQALKQRREDLSRGYSGQELGAMREQARSEIEGQRQNALRSLSGKAARGGIGGARAAAMQGAANSDLLGKRAEMERKMALDNANMVRSGTKDLQDYIMGQKYGELGTGLGYAQLGVADRAADAQAAAANAKQKQGLFASVLNPFLEGLF